MLKYFSLAVVVIVGSIINESTAEDVSQLEVVTTYSELFKQAKLDAGNGLSVQLGIDSRNSHTGTAGLVYCFVKYKTLKIANFSEALGPVKVRVQRQNEINRLADEVSSRLEFGQQDAESLFVRSLPFPRPGVYTVTISRQDDTPIARASVNVKEHIQDQTTLGHQAKGRGATVGSALKSHRWLPLERVFKKQDELQELHTDGPLFPLTVGNGEAIPKWTGYSPIHYRLPNQKIERAKSEALPKLFPIKPSRELRLTLAKKNPNDARGQVIHIDSRYPLAAYDVESHFLGRWWVNDKPLVPDPTTKRQLHDFSGLVFHEKKMRFDLQVDRKKLKAKAGDKIGFQLLYCPEGWEWIVMDLEQLAVMETENAPAHPLLSQRVEFKLE